MNDNKQTLTFNGQVYAMSDLQQVACDTLGSHQFVEARLQQLRSEMVVSQTAHVDYARALQAQLAYMPVTVSSTTPSL